MITFFESNNYIITHSHYVKKKLLKTQNYGQFQQS